MNERYISKRWTTPNQRGSFSALSGFLRNSPQFKDKKLVENVLSGLHSFSVHTPSKRIWKRRKVITAFTGQVHAIDLGDYSKYSKENNNFKWIFLICDIFSKYLWCYKLKDKSAKSVFEALQVHFKKKSNVPKKIWSDNGKEFKNRLVTDLLQKYNVTLYSTLSRLKSVYAEVYLKIIKTKLERWFTYTKTHRWVDVLDKLVISMNNAVNTRTKLTPASVFENKKFESLAWFNQYRGILDAKPRKPKFRVNQLVRVSRDRLLFDKAYEQGFMDEVFRIKEIRFTKPVEVYVLEDLSGEQLNTSFYREELVGVPSIPTE